MSSFVSDECRYFYRNFEIWEKSAEKGGHHGKSEWHKRKALPKGKREQQQHFVEECRNWSRECRTVSVPNGGHSPSPKTVQTTQCEAEKKVPFEFLSICPSLLINGGDVNNLDSATADGFDREIFSRPCGGFRIRVKAVGFEPNDFSLFVSSDRILGVDATHKKQTRDGLSVERRITRRYQMASQVDLGTMCAFLTADGQFLEITGAEVGKGIQQQQNWTSHGRKITEEHFHSENDHRRIVPYTTMTSSEFGRAENEREAQRTNRWTPTF